MLDKNFESIDFEAIDSQLNINSFNFPSFEDYIKFIIEYTFGLAGRTLKKVNCQEDFIHYEDDLYSIKLELKPLFYRGYCYNKNIQYTEGLPYYHKHKNRIHRKEWHEKEDNFVKDIKRMIISILSIDNNNRILGLVTKTNFEKGYGFLRTYNCYNNFFSINKMPDNIKHIIKPGCLLKFRQGQNPIRIKSFEYVEAIDFDSQYIKYASMIPLIELPGFNNKLEKIIFLIKHTQHMELQLKYTKDIAPILFNLLQYRKQNEYIGKNYIGKWDNQSRILSLLNKNTSKIKMLAQKTDYFFDNWKGIYLTEPFEYLSKDDIANFQEIKIYLENKGVNFSQV
ncbi:hypothetical protein [Dolichospermum circinale]|uniref:hypothetical protein n=1 Tax=Dolichospermum circinale TaxID=109265 RepID=UPI0004168A2C|nr:hypothetical protein [Dolichospermum circinale]MDB9474324.1 hypothetical protein [Dolichospermum circinale CS-537/11]MDB9480763.1 hypothetical protein [Dolichospermum circinale CS-537/03]MDB9481144.1 hypothetical protein [Dolichospermum circinale CS-537/05]